MNQTPELNKALVVARNNRDHRSEDAKLQRRKRTKPLKFLPKLASRMKEALRMHYGHLGIRGGINTTPTSSTQATTPVVVLTS